MGQSRRGCRARSLAMALLALLSASAGAADNPTSAWVHPGPDGKLVYKTTETGDRIMDFSHAGYMGGGVALPEVPVRKTLHPTGGADETAAIQQAIDEISAMPLEGRFRGAVLLGPGTFNCAGTLRIAASGVVLRGSGSDGAAATTLKLIGSPHAAITVRPPPGEGAETIESQTHVIDPYVPCGAISFNVADAAGLAVGDTLSTRKAVTKSWVEFMQMHDLVRDGRPQTWLAPGRMLATERQIAGISGQRITLDVPLSDSLDARFIDPPGAIVAKIKPPARVSQVGIESLHIESPAQEISHSQPHFTAMRINGQDLWVRDVTIDETMNSVGVGGKRITLQRVAIRRKARHQGASKPAEFAPNAGQVLLDRCTVAADNVWFVATGGAQAGPIVVLNCTFNGSGRAESHQRWSTGMLYDNCRAPDGGIELRNRGSMGSGHGWSMGWGVVWNCLARDYIIQSPPGAMNWLIGSIGENKLSPRPFGSGPMLPPGVLDSHGTPVAPQSLYLAQLAERLGPQALRNIGYDLEKPDALNAGSPAIRASSHEPPSMPELGANLALHRPVTTSTARQGKREYSGWQALDGDPKTHWATDDNVTQATLELDTEGAVEIDTVELVEAPGFEHRVLEYRVEGQVDSEWKLLAQGTTIGRSKVHRFSKVTLWKARLVITRAQAHAAIGEFGLYLSGSPETKRSHP